MKLLKLVATLALVLNAPDVFACIHADGGPGFKQTGFEVVLAHNEGVQTTIIQPKFSLDKSKPLGWVFPVPKLPSKIDIADKKTFKDLDKHFVIKPKKKSLGLRSKKKNGVTVHKTVKVGPFSITPIEGGYKGVSEWMAKHKFSPIPESHLKPYLDKGYVVLATKIDVKVDRKKASKAGELPPILLQFESEEIVFPFMFERTKERVMFKFFVFTPKAIPDSSYEKLAAERNNEENRKSPREVVRFLSDGNRLKSTGGPIANMPRSLQKLFGSIGFPEDGSIVAEVFNIMAASHEDAEKGNLPDISLAVAETPESQPVQRAELDEVTNEEYELIEQPTAEEKKIDGKRPPTQEEIAQHRLQEAHRKKNEKEKSSCATRTESKGSLWILLLAIVFLSRSRRV